MVSHGFRELRFRPDMGIMLSGTGPFVVKAQSAMKHDKKIRCFVESVGSIE